MLNLVNVAFIEDLDHLNIVAVQQTHIIKRM